MADRDWLERLRLAAEKEFSPETLKRLLPRERSAAYGGAGKQQDLHTVLAGAGLSGSPLPHQAARLMLALLYWQNYRVNGGNPLHQKLETALAGEPPVLYYENDEEEAVAAQLCRFLKADEEESGMILGLGVVSAGLAAYVWLQAEQYIKTADIAAALTLEAVRGETGAFDARLHQLARPYPGQIDAAENVRRLIAGSEMTTERGRLAYGYDQHPRVQDAISLRAMPQTHGGVRDVHAWLGENLAAELEAGMPGESFLLEYSLDWLAMALADLGNISEERTFRLNDERMSYGLPTNLVFRPGYNHGYAVVQACQAGVLAELKLKALPSAAVKTDGECMAYDSALRLMKALPLLSKVLATEVLMAAQGMSIVADKLPDLRFGEGTAAVLAEFRKHVDTLVENRFISPDMVAADELVADGTILRAAQRAVGALK